MSTHDDDVADWPSVLILVHTRSSTCVPAGMPPVDNCVSTVTVLFGGAPVTRICTTYLQGRHVGVM